MRRIEMGGRRFGKLAVVGPAPNSKAGRTQSECLCDCGNTAIVSNNMLMTGRTQSCGCYGKSRRAEANTKHGMKRSKEYQTWLGIKARTLNPNYEHWHRYGGRGIKVCERWLESFENFFQDMGPAPTKQHQIDRIDNDGDYGPSNCRWASRSDNMANRSNAIMITFKGETHCLSEWSRISGVKRQTLTFRIKHGWDPERALSV